MKTHAVILQDAVLSTDSIGHPDFVANHLVMNLLNGNSYGGEESLPEAQEEDPSAKLYSVQVTIEFEEIKP